MYRVSEASPSGTGSVPGAVGGGATGCCSGCGGAADMMEVVDDQRGTDADHRESHTARIYAPTLTSTLDQSVRGHTGVSSEMAQDRGEDEDYFAHFEDLELTEEDLAHIDRICEGEFYASIPEPVPPLSESKGQARVTIEVEQELQSAPEVVSPPTSSPRSSMSEPPYDAFRSGKSLSVSDLTGPLWCVDRAKIHPSIEQRPVGASCNMSIGSVKGGVSKLETVRRRSFPEREIR